MSGASLLLAAEHEAGAVSHTLGEAPPVEGRPAHIPHPPGHLLRLN